MAELLAARATELLTEPAAQLELKKPCRKPKRPRPKGERRRYSPPAEYHTRGELRLPTISCSSDLSDDWIEEASRSGAERGFHTFHMH